MNGIPLITNEGTIECSRNSTLASSFCPAEILLFVMLDISRIQVLSSRRWNPRYVTSDETFYTVL